MDKGLEPHLCDSEEEARGKASELIVAGKWPCYFFDSDTTGEKDFEEFFTGGEDLDLSRFDSIGVIRNAADFDSEKLLAFEANIKLLRERGTWKKEELRDVFFEVLPGFAHKETGKYLDQRM
jgi:hypothetical protein